MEKLRLKAKKFLPNGPELKTSFGEEHRKYWFGPDDIRGFLVADASEIQARELSLEDRKAFEQEAGPVLDQFGYEPAPNAVH